MDAFEHIRSWDDLRAFFGPHKWDIDEQRRWIAPPEGRVIPLQSIAVLVPALQRFYRRRAHDELTVFAIVDQHVAAGAGDTPQRAWAYGERMDLPPHMQVDIDEKSIPPEFLESCATSTAAHGKPMDIGTMRERVREELGRADRGELDATLDGAARLKVRARARL